MDALQLLKRDHDQVKKLLKELEDTTSRAAKTREKLFADIKQQMETHETIEEEIFYPALRDHPKTKDLVLEAYEEHHVVDQIIAEMAEMPVTDESWGAKAAVMKENIEHHIKEEEEELFPQARKLLGKEDLEELGEELEERKLEVLDEASELDDDAEVDVVTAEDAGDEADMQDDEVEAETPQAEPPRRPRA